MAYKCEPGFSLFCFEPAERHWGLLGVYVNMPKEKPFDKHNYCSVMGYGGRLRLSLLCFLSPLYVVVFTACPQSQFTNSNGTISSPGFNTSQSYDHNLTCTYRITVPANRWVVLEIIKLSILGTMPDCQGDSLEILVG